MIQLQHRYKLRVESMTGSSFCFFLVFWSSIYSLLLVTSHLGPSLYTSQFINSPFNTCSDHYQYGATESLVESPNQSQNQLDYYHCQISLARKDYNIEDAFLLRIIAIPRSEDNLHHVILPLNITVTQLVLASFDENATASISHEISLPSSNSTELFPAVNKADLNGTNWVLVQNNETQTLVFNCDPKNTILPQTFEGCFSQPILQQRRQELQSRYLFYIRIPKVPYADKVVSLKGKAQETGGRNLTTVTEQEEGNFNETDTESENTESSNGTHDKASSVNTSEEGTQNEISTPNDKEVPSADRKSQNNQNADSIRKVLFQVRSRNARVGVEVVLRWIFSSAAIGFLVYSIYSLKNFYTPQLLPIQKYIKILLILLFFWDIPLELISQEFEYLNIFAELLFLTLLIHFYLSIDTMNSSSSHHSAILTALKIGIVALLNIPQAIKRALEADYIADNLGASSLNNLLTTAFMLQCLLTLLAAIRVCKAKYTERRFKFLCCFSHGVMAVFSYWQYNTLFIPEDLQLGYFQLSKLTILNIYVYIITFLYLPVESKESEQQYNIEAQPHQEDEEENPEEKRREIFGDIYKDIEMNDHSKDTSGIAQTPEEIRKQKIWEKIQKSLHDEGEDDDDEDGENHSHLDHIEHDSDSDNEDSVTQRRNQNEKTNTNTRSTATPESSQQKIQNKKLSAKVQSKEREDEGEHQGYSSFD